MSDETRPPEEPRGPETAAPVPAGAVTTSERPVARPQPPPQTPDDGIEVIETPPEIDVDPVDGEGERDPATIALDDADTVELAVADLRAAAAEAGVDVDAVVGPAPAPGETAPGDTAPDGAPDDTDGSTTRFDPMDPRLRERRIAVTRAEGRRRLRILLAAVTVASALGIAWLVVQSPLLAVDDIKVQGVFHETPDGVRAVSGVAEGAALVFVDEADVARRIEQLPWVAEANVSREFPNGLRIEVVERLPVAWIRRPSPPGAPRGTGVAALVDASGRILGDEPGPPAGFPELAGSFRIGAPGTRLQPAGFARAVAELPDALRAQVGAVTEARGQAVLVLVQPPGGPEPAADEVRLGALSEIPAKGAAALAVLDQLTRDESHVSYIDVRVPSAPATR